MKIEEEIDLKKQNIEELNKELDSLFTKSAIDILKIKGFNFTVFVSILALLLISIGNTEIFSNTLINLIYVVMIPCMPLLMFGNPLKNKKALKENKIKIAEIVDVKEPELKKEIAKLQETLNLNKTNNVSDVTLKNSNLSFSNNLINNISNGKINKQGPVLKLVKDKKEKR